VVHRSDKKPRKMVVVQQCFGKTPPDGGDIHQEMVNIGAIRSGSYYCTWISGSKVGSGYFQEVELESEPQSGRV